MKNKTMQQAIFWMVIAFGIFLIIDIYTFQAIKLAFGNHTWINVVYWLITLFVLGYMIYSTQSYDRASAPQKIINNFMGLMVLSYVPKLLIIILLFSEDLFRLVQGSIVFLVDFFTQGSRSRRGELYPRETKIHKSNWFGIGCHSLGFNTIRNLQRQIQFQGYSTNGLL